MNIDITSICERRLKSTFAWVVNKVNDTELELDVDQLSLNPSSDKRILVKDVSSPSGVLVSKVDISNLFSDTLDLRPFKNIDKSKHQTNRDLSQEQLVNRVNSFNKARKFQMVTVSGDYSGNFAETDEELLSNFFLFCKVVGFWELNPDDVTMVKTITEVPSDDDGMSFIEERIVMTVVGTHPYYCGTIEVLI